MGAGQSVQNVLGENPGRPVQQQPRDADPDLLVVRQLQPPMRLTIERCGEMPQFDPIERRPSEYWREHCYASFQNDLLGLSQLDYIGADRVMWASDYPHSEGSFGFSRRSIQSVIDAAGSDAAGRIVGGTATALYDL